MQTQVHSDPDDVRSALERLGVTEAALRRAIFAGWAERAACTGNDAPIAPGFLQWNRTLRTLREQLAPSGWRASNDDRYFTAVNAAGDLAVAVASGCANTGLPRRPPTTRSRKGPSTCAAVERNHDQFELPFAPVSLRRAAADGEGRVTWLLLFHVDEREIRAELSLPVGMDEDGHVDRWRERIIIARTPLDPTALPIPAEEPDQPIDVPVRRRA